MWVQKLQEFYFTDLLFIPLFWNLITQIIRYGSKD